MFNVPCQAPYHVLQEPVFRRLEGRLRLIKNESPKEGLHCQKHGLRGLKTAVKHPVKLDMELAAMSYLGISSNRHCLFFHPQGLPSTGGPLVRGSSYLEKVSIQKLFYLMLLHLISCINKHLSVLSSQQQFQTPALMYTKICCITLSHVMSQQTVIC